MKNYQGGIIERLLSSINDESRSGAGDSVANQFKDFIDEIPGGFLVYKAGEDEEILYANAALLNIFKCGDFKEFYAHTGGTFRGMVHPDDLNEVEKSIKEQISQSPDYMDYVEYRIICRDGTVRRVEDYGHFANTESGEVFYVFISDATEKINLRLQERIQRLEIIEGLSVNYDSIIYFDLENGVAVPCRLSSRTKEQFKPNWEVKTYLEIIKDYVATWVHPEDKASVLESLAPAYMESALKDSTTYYFNYRCIQNGEVIHLQLRIVNVGKEGTAKKFVLGFRRIDEEILSEIKQKQILEDALKAAKLAEVAKDNFLANMSHDMRTPLNAIFGFAALAKRNLADTESVKYYLDRIEEAGRQILDLTAKVLEATDAKTQDYVVRETACSLTEIMDEVLKVAKAKALPKGVRVEMNLDGLEHSSVFTDGNKIKSILSSISGNAVKFNKKGGRVDITVTERPYGDCGLATYCFSVADTGVGISPDAFERIFDPFEREKDTTESGVSGAGLGLTLAKHNADMLGGIITVDSVKGEGSTFKFTLNLRHAEGEAASGGEVGSENLQGLKILFVEDNDINLEIGVEILQDAGFIVDTAENGKIAVDKISAAPEGAYDFVLMDIQMPVMDGRQATAVIRKLEGARSQIPIIALSANAFERDKRLSLERGMNAHLTKPMDVEQIKRTVAEIFKKRKGK